MVIGCGTGGDEDWSLVTLAVCSSAGWYDDSNPFRKFFWTYELLLNDYLKSIVRGLTKALSYLGLSSALSEMSSMILE